MNATQHLQNVIDQAIDQLTFPKDPEGLYEPISYFLTLGGKRIRPVLMLMALEMFQKDIHPHIQTALSLEIFHNFTLVHDDMMDNAPIRRGKTTVHQKWNSNTAILSGDAMLIKAYEYLQNVPKEHFLEIICLFNKTALEVCEGQQLDMNFEKINSVDISEYIHMIELKTAVLLGCSLKMGAILADAAAQDAENLYQFGTQLGIAFQLQDDLLDAFAPDEQFGKQNGGDIISNKKTFLLLKAFELAQGTDAKTLQHLVFEDHQINDNDKVTRIIEIYKNLEIDLITKKEVQKYAQNALDALDQIKVSDTQKAPLKFLVEFLNQRKN